MPLYLHRQLYILPGMPTSAGWVWWTAASEDLGGVGRPAFPGGGTKASFVQIVEYDDIDPVSSIGAAAMPVDTLPGVALTTAAPFLDLLITGTHTNVSAVEVWIDGAFAGLATLTSTSDWEFTLAVSPGVPFDLDLVVRTNSSLVAFDTHLAVAYEPITIQPLDITIVPGWTFSRNSIATDGLPSTGLPADDVDTYAAHELRDVSEKIGVASDHWYLIEGERSNRVFSSADLDPAGPDWILNGAAAINGMVADPLGGTGAVDVLSTVGAGSTLRPAVAVNWAGAGSPSHRVQSFWSRNGTPGGVAMLRFDSPTVDMPFNTTPDWVRSAVPSTWTANIVPYIRDSGDGTETWGWQVEPVSFANAWASSFIPTTGAAVTRLADDARFIMPSWWKTGTIKFEVVPAWPSAELMAAAIPAAVVVENVGGGQHIYLGDRSLVGGPAGFGVVFSTATVGSHWTTAAISIDAGDLIELEVDWVAETCAVYINTVLVDTIAFTGTWPEAQWALGRSVSAGGAELYGLVRVLTEEPPEYLPTTFEGLDGYTFTRGSTATDGLPSTGLPADDVDSYGVDQIRYVSDKVGALEDGWYLLEGASTNWWSRSNDLTVSPWTVVNTVTRTGGQADPMGGTTAARLECAAPGTLNGVQTGSEPLAGAADVPMSIGAWIREAPAPGLWGWLTQNPNVSLGGSAPAAWTRTVLKKTSTNSNQAVYLMINNDQTANGGIVAGARDAIFAFPQAERQRWASSYIVTTGTVGTRLGDDLAANIPERWTRGVLRMELVPAYSSAERVGAGLHVALINAVDARFRFVVSGSDLIPRLETWDGVFSAPAVVFAAGDTVRVEIDWEASEFRVYVNAVLASTTAFTGAWLWDMPCDLGHEANAQHVDGLFRILTKRGIGYPVLEGIVDVGRSLTLTSRSGGDGASLYTVERAGVPIAGLVNVTVAAVQGYALVAADCGPDLVVLDAATGLRSNPVRYDYRQALTAMVAGWDAEHVTPIGAEVDVVVDQSTLGNNLSSPGAHQRARYFTEGFNGGDQPFIRIETADLVRRTGMSWGGADPTEVESFVVVKTRVRTSFAVLASFTTSDPATLRYLPREAADTTGGPAVSTLDPTTVTIQGSTDLAAAPRMIYARGGPGGSSVGISNNAPEASNAVARAFTGMHGGTATLGSLYSGTSLSQADIALQIHCAATQTANQRAGFWAYCDWRFGLTRPFLQGGAMEIGTSPLTIVSRSGDDGSFLYTLRRDGVPVAGFVSVTAATIATYTIVEADIGPGLTVFDENSGLESNPVRFDDAAYFPGTTIGVSTQGVGLAGSDVQTWSGTLGGVPVTLAADAPTNRPAYDGSGGVGGRPRITFDGIDDCLHGILTKGSAWDDYEWGVVKHQTAATAAGATTLAYTAGTVARFRLTEQSSGNYRVTVAGGANVEPGIASTAMQHWSGDAAVGGTINARLAGNVEATTSSTVTSRPDGNSLSLGAVINVAPAAFHCQAWYCGPLLTATQRTHLRALLAYHTGVAA